MGAARAMAAFTADVAELEVVLSLLLFLGVARRVVVAGVMLEPDRVTDDAFAVILAQPGVLGVFETLKRMGVLGCLPDLSRGRMAFHAAFRADVLGVFQANLHFVIVARETNE